ncbi:MAG: hypothetical protein OEY50_11710 [Nitrospinota bacterium]|nr:hypothetical protein [Nitrospinota bacterium]MDH5679609.1 hypothetical protein [Nitrospinota bacterium]
MPAITTQASANAMIGHRAAAWAPVIGLFPPNQKMIAPPTTRNIVMDRKKWNSQNGS